MSPRRVLNRRAARLPQVRAAVARQTQESGAAAKAQLVKHRAEGMASIRTVFGDVDGYVVLHDPDIPGADGKEKLHLGDAIAIEFGRKGGTRIKVDYVDNAGRRVSYSYVSTPSRPVHALKAALKAR